jgi:nicotinamidase-related amidase
MPRGGRIPVEVSALIDPRTTALVLQECQEGVIGKQSALPEIARAAQRELIPNALRLVRAAHAAGARVIHCTAVLREDFFGLNTNARLFHHMRKAPVKLWPGTDAVKIVPELTPEPRDVVLTRSQGLSPFTGSELDLVLRNAGITTLVVAGVSLNVAIPNLVFDAVNHAYQVVIPRDAVAGTPAEYGEQVLDHTLSAIATLTTTPAIESAWKR